MAYAGVYTLIWAITIQQPHTQIRHTHTLTDACALIHAHALSESPGFWLNVKSVCFTLHMLSRQFIWPPVVRRQKIVCTCDGSPPRRLSCPSSFVLLKIEHSKSHIVNHQTCLLACPLLSAPNVKPSAASKSQRPPPGPARPVVFILVGSRLGSPGWWLIAALINTSTVIISYWYWTLVRYQPNNLSMFYLIWNLWYKHSDEKQFIQLHHLCSIRIVDRGSPSNAACGDITDADYWLFEQYILRQLFNTQQPQNKSEKYVS